ncbi:hypothetical protein RHS01_07919 [Rhizoctonia solani]|uniref:Uncharacterized protein n=1 Tax=Rhizoctonia solani TaxID=456999 RepID=A0A8H7I672_9AGAM|nr:hypothetical protein RHS01_07919 [Rhizoctonia solani]
MRSLALYIDGHDPPTSKRLLDELEVGVVCDQLAEDLYLYECLAVALRKINQSYIRARSEVVELQAERTSLEAERDEAWLMAESLERELVESKHLAPLRRMIPCRPNLRARRVARLGRPPVLDPPIETHIQTKHASLGRSSTSSMRYHSILFRAHRRPPRHLSISRTPTRAAATSCPRPAGPNLSAFSRGRVRALALPWTGSEVVGVTTPSATSHDLYVAQNELLTMLGLSYKEYGFKDSSSRSYSECESPPAVPSSPPGGGAGGVFAARMSGPPSSFHRPSSRGKLFRSSSDQR